MIVLSLLSLKSFSTPSNDSITISKQERDVIYENLLKVKLLDSCEAKTIEQEQVIQYLDTSYKKLANIIDVQQQKLFKQDTLILTKDHKIERQEILLKSKEKETKTKEIKAGFLGGGVGLVIGVIGGILIEKFK
jgi:fatty acid-binding protein DegV